MNYFLFSIRQCYFISIAGKTRRGSSNTSETKFLIADARDKRVNSDEEDYEEYGENDETLTNIASGQMMTGGICNDFFGDSEIGGDIELETFVATTSNNSDTKWELKSEAFEPRINLNDELPEEDELQDRYSAQDEGGQPDQNASNDEFKTEIVVVDQTSSLLCVDTALITPSWTSTNIIRDTLKQFAEHGDVQTAVCMYMVLLRSKTNFKILIDDPTLEYWLNCYIELLQRMKLFNNATALIKMCAFIPEIYNMTHQSTTVLSNCTTCNKALSRSQGSWWCERCQKTPNLCCICLKLVKGLFVWCQGCSHGGHLKCLKSWFSDNTICPTGCGHYCEYQ